MELDTSAMTLCVCIARELCCVHMYVVLGTYLCCVHTYVHSATWVPVLCTYVCSARYLCCVHTYVVLDTGITAVVLLLLSILLSLLPCNTCHIPAYSTPCTCVCLHTHVHPNINAHTCTHRHDNGCVLLRSSQPKVGWFSYRNAYDEKLLLEISRSCDWHMTTSGDCSNGISRPLSIVKNGSSNHLEQTCQRRLLIFDLRAYMACLGNRAKGGGTENPGQYMYVCTYVCLHLSNYSMGGGLCVVSM